MTATAPLDGQWCDAPEPVRGGPTLWHRRLSAVKEQPGQWARFGPYPPLSTGKQVAKIKRGVYGEGFDARRVNIEHQDWICVCFSAVPSGGEG